jgi:cell division protein FtsI (penicillin-binding protein 3)
VSRGTGDSAGGGEDWSGRRAYRARPVPPGPGNAAPGGPARGSSAPGGPRGPARPRPGRVPGRQQPRPGRPARIGDTRRRPAGRTAPASGRGGPGGPSRPPLRCVGPAKRLNLTLVVVAFVMSVFAGRLVQIQGMDSGRYATDAAQQRMQPISVPAVRGSIVTSDGTVLAMTVQTDSVIADPQQIPVPERAVMAANLAGLLKVPAADLLATLDRNSPKSQYALLGTNVPMATAARIAAMKLPGLSMTPTYSSSYPNGNLASDIVGYTTVNSATGDLQGVGGLEAEFNSVLKGRDGRQDVEVGTDGEPIPMTQVKTTPVVGGRSLRLTINANIQFAAEQECQRRVAMFHARNCSIIVMDPQSGAILAMAQWPTETLADFQQTGDTSNISTNDVFAPGSTLKSISVAAALEKGHQTPMSAYTIPYAITVDHYPFHDAEPHPTVRYTVAGILAHSSNVGMVQLVQHITPIQQYDYLRAFGLGSPSGLNLPGESAGLLPKPGSPNYYGDSPFENSFGQGVAVTAIQMASVYATIANGGVRVQPTLVAGSTTSAGVYHPAKVQPGRRVIQPKTARELMKILQQVPAVDADAGEPYGIIHGYTVASKTGTAQVSDPENKCALCQYGSSYIGIAPADNPKLVVAVNIQDPKGSQFFGDEVAGPAFYDVMRFALQTMKIPPDNARTPYIRLTAP